jgi:hypothetical protein
MIYFLLILVALLTALMLLRVRIRVDLSGEHRLMFLGLGRTGPEFDFERGIGQFRLFGFSVKTFSLKREKKDERPVEATPIEKVEKAPSAKPKRERSVWDVMAMTPQIVSAFWRFLAGIVKSAMIEQCEGEVRAGFEEPHLTGQAFGYYHALVGMAPAVGRFQFVPDWTGASFAGTMRLSLALPMYALVYRTCILIFQLPVRRLIKYAIGKKKGNMYDK